MVTDIIAADWFFIPFLLIVAGVMAVWPAIGNTIKEFPDDMRWWGIGVMLSLLWLGYFCFWAEWNPLCEENGEPPPGKTWCRDWHSDVYIIGLATPAGTSIS